MKAEFGFYPEPLTLSMEGLEVETLPDLDEAVASVLAGGVEAGWFYAPPAEGRHFGNEGHIVSTKPYPSRVFNLPKTHVIRHAAARDHDHLAFLVWALSFFKGIRLTTTEAGFLDATPVTIGKLVDFIVSAKNLAEAVRVADTFWNANGSDPQAPKRFAAAVHALFLGQNPQLLQFEKFIFLYTALDACFALASSLHPSPTRPSHAGRLAWMCGIFDMAVPDWAGRNLEGKAEVAVLRNDTLHEALFVGEPLGFAIHGAGTGRNMMLEMEALICRLLVALLGAPANAYVRTPINTRQRHLLAF